MQRFFLRRIGNLVFEHTRYKSSTVMALQEIGVNCCSEHVDSNDKSNPNTFISLLCRFRSFLVVVNENQNELQGRINICPR